ncbi:MAG: ABC transporter substrate-binding protein [Nitrososphaerales archaeon]
MLQSKKSAITNKNAVGIAIVLLIVGAVAGYFGGTSTVVPITTTTRETITVTKTVGTGTTETIKITETTTKTITSVQTITTSIEKTPTTTTGKYGGTLVIAVDDQGYGNLDVAYSPSVQFTSTAIMGIYEPLIVRDINWQLKPNLAESWEQIDEVTWIFKLRQGVKFHDGTPFNASAVVFTINRSISPDKPSWASATVLQGVVKTVEAIDDYTVKFTLTRPFVEFLDAVAGFRGFASPSAVKRLGDEAFGRNPVGTGPFKFVSWVQNQYLEMEAFEDYWQGRPYLDKVIIRIIPEASVRLLELEKGNIDILWIEAEQASRVKANPNLKLIEGSSTKWHILSMNLQANATHPALLDKRVRQAINYAINRAELIQALEYGYATPAISMILPIWKDYWDPSLKMYPDNGDIEKAKQLLAQAGYPNGFEVEILGSPYLKFDQTALIIQNQLAKVGIKAKVSTPEFAVFAQTVLTSKPWQMAVHDVNIPYLKRFYDFYRSGPGIGVFNIQHVNDPILDELLDQAIKESNFAKSKELYTQISKRIIEEAYGAPLYYPSRIYVTQEYVEGFYAHPHPWYGIVVSLKSAGIDTYIAK